jgi:hypothetical protein
MTVTTIEQKNLTMPQPVLRALRLRCFTMTVTPFADHGWVWTCTSTSATYPSFVAVLYETGRPDYFVNTTDNRKPITAQALQHLLNPNELNGTRS